MMLFGGTVLAGLAALLSLSEPRPAWWAVPVAVALGLALARREGRVKAAGGEPSNLAFYTIFFGMPAYFEEVRHLDRSSKHRH